jgi:Ca2+-binding EF-hand superfamily protein
MSVYYHQSLKLYQTEWKEAFSMYDKKGNSTVSSDNLGDLLRGLGQNPTQAEVRELIKSLGGSDKHGKDILSVYGMGISDFY